MAPKNSHLILVIGIAALGFLFLFRSCGFELFAVGKPVAAQRDHTLDSPAGRTPVVVSRNGIDNTHAYSTEAPGQNLGSPTGSAPPNSDSKPGGKNASRRKSPRSSEKHIKILRQEMVLIPAGEFVMGLATKDAIGPYDHLNLQHIGTTGAFWIDKYEVTNAMFREFLDETGYEPRDMNDPNPHFLDHWKNGDIPEGAENQPVRWVNLEDAGAYATWVGKRLPTQEEWEKAARGTDGRKYPWGNQWDATRFTDLSHQRFNDDVPTDSDSHPDGASPYGVFNMEGNIAEWTTTRIESPWPWKYDYLQRKGISGPGILSTRPAATRYASTGFRCVKDASP